MQADDGQHPAGCTASVEESSDTGEDALPRTDDVSVRPSSTQ